MFIRMCQGIASWRNVAVRSRQTWKSWKIASLFGREQVVERPGPTNFWATKTATLMRMIALQAGAAPESHPEPRVLSR